MRDYRASMEGREISSPVDVEVRQALGHLSNSIREVALSKSSFAEFCIWRKIFWRCQTVLEHHPLNQANVMYSISFEILCHTHPISESHT